jgi:Putative Ig domain
MTILKAYACVRDTSRKNRSFIVASHGGRPSLLRTSAALSLLCFALIFISNCGGSGASGISIEINAGTNSTIDQGQTLLLTATVGGDTNNLGVVWSIPTTNTTCSGANCGTLTNTTNFLATYTSPTNLSTTLTVMVEATAKANASVTKTISITVVLPPTFTTTGLTECQLDIFCLKNGANGVPYSQALAASGGVSPLIYTVPANTLPAGLSLSVQGVITGTPSGPTSSQPGPVLFTVTITDSATMPLTVTQQFQITITPPPPLSITSPPTLPGGYINGSYAAAIATVGGVPPFTWSLVSGALPPGLNLGKNSGQITGIPTSAAQTGVPYIFTVQIEDSSLPSPGQIKQATLSITIQTPQVLAISTTSLPNGMTATGYNTSIVATGGIPPYTWSLISGQLPEGLTFGSNGAITGTPFIVTSTPAVFTVQVQDSELNPSTGLPEPETATEQLSMSVVPGTPSNNTLFSGSYSFLFNGFDSFGSVAIAGTLNSSGNGVIPGGTVDETRGPESLQDTGILSGTNGPDLTGTYSLGVDGRGTMELLVTNPTTKVVVTSDFQIVMESDRTVRFFENDATGTRGAGILKPVSGPTNFGAGSFNGNYAFEFTGADLAGSRTAFGGVITSNGNAALSGGFGDYNEGGSFSGGLNVSGSFATGQVNRSTATLTYQLPTKSQVTLNFAFYFVNAKDVFMVGSDVTDATHPRLSGEFILQDPAIQFGKSSLEGASVVSGTGLDGTTADVMAGLFTGAINPNGSTSATFSYDENDGGAISSTSFPCLECATPSYSVGTNGRATFSNLAPVGGTSKLAAAYLTGTGTGFFIGSDPAVTFGVLEAQQPPLLPATTFSSSDFEGGYTLSSPAMAENQVPNVVGQVVATGAGSVTGTLDEVDPTAANVDQSLVANYTVAGNGRGTMTSNGLVGFPVNLAFYIVSPGSVRLISLDSNPGSGHPYVIFFDH